MKTGTRRWFVGLCFAGGLGAAACLSPTLPPLPPPSEPDMSYVADGRLRLSGSVPVDRSARVIAVNNRNSQLSGEITDTGRYDFTLPAEPGDDIEFWYEVGAKVSDSVFVKAPSPGFQPLPVPSSSEDLLGPQPLPTLTIEPETTLDPDFDAGAPDAATSTTTTGD
jgi:hypothetical protein